MMLESALVTYHGRIICASKGTPGSVEFDFEAVWAFKKKWRSDFNAKYIRWLHVHPRGFGTQFSTQDQICAAGLAAALGSVERFGILCFSNDHPDNIHGDLRWYKWDREHQTLVPDTNLGDIEAYLEDRHAYVLKTLSYGDLWQPKASQSMASEPSAQISSSN